MKSLICAVFAAAVLATPAVSFAQVGNAPVSRAKVKTDLMRVEQAGYNPARNDLAGW